MAGSPLTPLTKPFVEVGQKLQEAPGTLASLFAGPWNDPKKLYTLLGVLVIIGLVVGLVFGGLWLANQSRKPLDTSPEKVVETERTRKDAILALPALNASKSLYGELIQQLDPSERYFVNLCPLTAMWGGYIGPVQKGVFSPKFYVQKALDAGIRSFVLPISWHKKPEFGPPQWPEQLRPGCLVRDDNEQIISINGLTVKNFVNELCIEIGNHGLAQRDEPILLSFVTTPSCPDRVKQEDDYVRMMCQIGQELGEISAFNSLRLATLGAYGSATGAAREQEILMQTPLEELRGKILVFTDFDTKLVLKNEYQDTRVFVRPSLHDFVNFQLHPEPACCAKPGQMINAKMIHLMDISGSRTVWRDEARTVWHTTLGDGPVTNIPAADLVVNANTNGIQMVPIPFFINPEEATAAQEVWKSYNGFAWKLKPANARYSKPPPVVPATPSSTLNARVANNLQPGQTQIS